MNPAATHSVTQASFAQATSVRFDRTLDDGTSIYVGDVDPTWSVMVVPQGGYLLGLVIEAIIHHQANTNQPDPIHISSHFLFASGVDSVEIHISYIKNGKRFSNLTANLVQKGRLNIASHVIVGVLPDPFNLTTNPIEPTILPPHVLAPRTPFIVHTRDAKDDPDGFRLKFRGQLRYAEDTSIKALSLERARSGESRGGIDSGAWYELVSEEPGTQVGISAMPFFADLCRNTTAIIPEPDWPGLCWYPTITFSLEFKVKLTALPADQFAPHTFGIFSTGKHVLEGRHEVFSEVWTAPSAFGQPGVNGDEWRDNMICVAIAQQMALTVSSEMNARNDKSRL